MKKLLTLGAILMLFATSLLALSGCSASGSVKEFLASALQEETLQVTEQFHSVHILSDTENVKLLPAEDGVCRIVSYNEKDITYTATVEQSILKIRREDARKWYERIFSIGEKTLTVYLPKREYNALTIEQDTGDVTIPADFHITGDLTLTLSTGDVDVRASVDGALDITASTGNVCVADTVCGTLDITASTGNVCVADTVCGALAVRVSTGDVTLTSVCCTNLLSTGNTGDIRMTDVIANGLISLERSTGHVSMDRCDAAELLITTDTGDVVGTLLSDKIFIVRTRTGNIDVPETVVGGKCKITTNTGDIEITIAAT